MKSDNSVESNKWIRSVQLVAHKVEVRSLAYFKDKLFSGGNKVYLNIRFYFKIILLFYFFFFYRY